MFRTSKSIHWHPARLITDDCALILCRADSDDPAGCVLFKFNSELSGVPATITEAPVMTTTSLSQDPRTLTQCGYDHDCDPWPGHVTCDSCNPWELSYFTLTCRLTITWHSQTAFKNKMTYCLTCDVPGSQACMECWWRSVLWRARLCLCCFVWQSSWRAQTCSSSKKVPTGLGDDLLCS
jgi:hypothetical protein